MWLKLYLWIRRKILKIDDRSQLEIAIEQGLSIGENCHMKDEMKNELTNVIGFIR